MAAVPERVKEQGPGRVPGALLRGRREQRRDRVRPAEFADRRRARDERTDRPGATRDPLAHRHRETALAGERLRLRYLPGEPAAQQPFAEPAIDLELVR